MADNGTGPPRGPDALLVVGQGGPLPFLCPMPASAFWALIPGKLRKAKIHKDFHSEHRPIVVLPTRIEVLAGSCKANRMTRIDPVALAQDLIRCPSVTPDEAGTITLLEGILRDAGFEVARPDRGGIANLFARRGPKGHPKTFGFNGHTDVVPTGDVALWSHDPFGAEIAGGKLWGRGAADMKSGVAAFVAAAVALVTEAPPDGAIVITVTGDEEGEGVDGTAAILDWMKAEGEAMSVCIVGEPTNPEHLGDMIKIGRRGSLNAVLTARGVQGHSAYPHRATNPVAAIAALATRLAGETLDEGTAHFDPSTLALTSIDTGNPAPNVIPAECRARLNIRFNDLHSSASLIRWIETEAARVTDETGVTIAADFKVSGESFLTPPGPLSDLVAAVVESETGRKPALSTTGGTSDARYVRRHCPVVEFGLVGRTMHQVDEHVDVADIPRLSAIYHRVLERYFA